MAGYTHGATAHGEALKEAREAVGHAVSTLTRERGEATRVSQALERTRGERDLLARELAEAQRVIAGLRAENGRLRWDVDSLGTDLAWRGGDSLDVRRALEEAALRRR